MTTIGHKFSISLESKINQEGKWFTRGSVTQAQSENLIDWDNKEIKSEIISSTYEDGLATVFMALQLELNRLGYTLFGEKIEEDRKELLN